MVAAAGPLLAVEPELLRLLGRSAADLAAAGRKASDVAALVAVFVARLEQGARVADPDTQPTPSPATATVPPPAMAATQRTSSPPSASARSACSAWSRAGRGGGPSRAKRTARRAAEREAAGRGRATATASVPAAATSSSWGDDVSPLPPRVGAPRAASIADFRRRLVASARTPTAAADRESLELESTDARGAPDSRALIRAFCQSVARSEFARSSSSSSSLPSCDTNHELCFSGPNSRWVGESMDESEQSQSA